MLNKLRGLVVEEKGQGMTEYGLVLGIIAIAVVGIIITLRDEIVELYTIASNALVNRTP
jgi:pilus assembly protein Flp/PilA